MHVDAHDWNVHSFHSCGCHGRERRKASQPTGGPSSGGRSRLVYSSRYFCGAKEGSGVSFFFLSFFFLRVRLRAFMRVRVRTCVNACVRRSMLGIFQQNGKEKDNRTHMRKEGGSNLFAEVFFLFWTRVGSATGKGASARRRKLNGWDGHERGGGGAGKGEKGPKKERGGE